MWESVVTEDGSQVTCKACKVLVDVHAKTEELQRKVDELKKEESLK